MFINDSQTENLTDEQWNVAHAIAKDLTEEETDVNELRKIMSYLQFINRDNIGSSFFEYLKVLTINGNKIRHSKKTIEYYRQIEITCKKYLKEYENNSLAMLTILGWVSRLMQYYKESPVGENLDSNSTESQSKTSERQQKIEDLTKARQFQVGEVLDANVIRKSHGKKVTYEVEGITYTEREQKNFDLIPENETVKVVIKSLKEDGSINHIKFYKQ
ncbi:MAG: hypothetical protein F6K17_14095 [Okeania sp. SIO3C4]|nr:hypothetical protein [Okeania sp. SIO3B3]NER03664.1 hypothetical protein [Okeania sp. SIO3C4]